MWFGFYISVRKCTAVKQVWNLESLEVCKACMLLQTGLHIRDHHYQSHHHLTDEQVSSSRPV